MDAPVAHAFAVIHFRRRYLHGNGPNARRGSLLVKGSSDFLFRCCSGCLSWCHPRSIGARHFYFNHTNFTASLFSGGNARPEGPGLFWLLLLFLPFWHALLFKSSFVGSDWQEPKEPAGDQRVYFGPVLYCLFPFLWHCSLPMG